MDNDLNRLLAQEEMDKTKLDLDSLENTQPQPRRILGESSTTTHTYRLYCKGLVSEELVKDDTMLVGGLGLSLCDSHDNTKLEINKALRNEELSHPEAAALAAIIHGLKWALELGVQSIQFFCDDNILGYVTRKAAPSESIVATLLEQVALLQTRFTSCQALAVSKDIISVYKLAKDAIASQTRWCEGDTNTELESCPVCYAYVSPHDKFEVRGCFHRICVTCMRERVSPKLIRENTLTCPYADCEEELVPEDCRGIADDDVITLMIHSKKEREIPVSERVYCPNPSCSLLMSDRELIRHAPGSSIDPRQSAARKCTECGLSFCKNCHVPWHHKKTCDEFKNSESYLKSEAALFESLVKTEGWRKCSKCETIVQHGGGCQQMTCTHCKHEFCYTCGAACKKKKLTCKCVRSGKRATK
ncbi:unnamed protein product [Thlaspi arvense]|uniref:RBR-type E3 ubiquitin transferase n=1 Tax=Thlaspi arvense TaxID=13288 RepID=A0AAU9SZK2_THLAR|nr:unnamed protein product [Thlaspi arvense]